MPKPDIAPRVSPPVSRVFLQDGQHPLAPKLFGLAAVTIALNSAQEDFKKMIDQNESEIQQRISSNAAKVYLHLIALHVAVYYACASMQSGSAEDVLAEIREGIKAGFAIVRSDEDDNRLEARMIEFLYELFEKYANSLRNELDEISGNSPERNRLDRSATATLVINHIAIQSDIYTLLADELLERLRLEKIVAYSGISLLLRLLLTRNITYAP